MVVSGANTNEPPAHPSHGVSAPPPNTKGNEVPTQTSSRAANSPTMLISSTPSTSDVQDTKQMTTELLPHRPPTARPSGAKTNGSQVELPQWKDQKEIRSSKYFAKDKSENEIDILGYHESVSATNHSRPLIDSETVLSVRRASVSSGWMIEAPKFHPFPRLPIELRHKIWKFSLPRATTIRIERFSNLRILGDGIHYDTPYFTQPIQFPNTVRYNAMLRTCSESHEVYCNSLPYLLPITIHEYEVIRFGNHTYRFGVEDVVHIGDFDALCENEADWAAFLHQKWVPEVEVLSIAMGADMLTNVEWKRVLQPFKSLRKLEGIYLGHVPGPHKKRKRQKAWKKSWAIGQKTVELENDKGSDLPDELVVSSYPGAAFG